MFALALHGQLGSGVKEQPLWQVTCFLDQETRVSRYALSSVYILLKGKGLIGDFSLCMMKYENYHCISVQILITR